MSTASDVGSTSYVYEEMGRTPVITFKAEMAQFPLGQVEEAGNALLERLNALKPTNLVVDLTELDYMGSAMVALIVRLWKAVKDQKGHRMVVAVDGEGVLEVLELARLTEHWTIVGSREEGAKLLGLKSGAASRPGSAPVSSGVGGEESPVLSIVAIVSGVAAVCGAVLVTKPALVSATVAIAITAVAAVVGLAVGTMLLLGESTARKAVGGVTALLCGIAIVLALVLYPNGPAPAGGQPAPAKPAARD